MAIKVDYSDWTDSQKQDFIEVLDENISSLKEMAKAEGAKDNDKMKANRERMEYLQLRFEINNSMVGSNEKEMEHQRLARKVVSLEYELKSYRERFGNLLEPYDED